MWRSLVRRREEGSPGEEATPGNAGGSGTVQGMPGTSSTSNNEVPSVWDTKTHTEIDSKSMTVAMEIANKLVFAYQAPNK